MLIWLFQCSNYIWFICFLFVQRKRELTNLTLMTPLWRVNSNEVNVWCVMCVWKSIVLVSTLRNSDTFFHFVKTISIYTLIHELIQENEKKESEEKESWKFKKRFLQKNSVLTYICAMNYDIWHIRAETKCLRREKKLVRFQDANAAKHHTHKTSNIPKHLTCWNSFSLFGRYTRIAIKFH